MNVAQRAKIMIVAVAVAVVGAVSVGSNAFTSAGLTITAPDEFVGGVESQSITGAVLETIGYSFSDGTKTAVSSVDLTFDAASAGHHVAVAFQPGNVTSDCVSDDDADPGPAAAEDKIGLETYGAVCTPTNAPMSSVTGITVTVTP